MTTRKCPGCGQDIYSADTVTVWRCPICRSRIPIPQPVRDAYIKSFPRRPRVRAWRYIRAGIRIGLTLVTAAAVVTLFEMAWTTYLARTGNPGGEVLVPVLVYLLMYGGWTLRRLWATYKGEEGNAYVKVKKDYSRRF